MPGPLILFGGAAAGRAALQFLARAGSRAARTGVPVAGRAVRKPATRSSTSKTAQAANAMRGRKAQAKRQTAQAKSTSRNNPFDANKLRAEDDRRSIAAAARSSARSKQIAKEKSQSAKGPKYGSNPRAKKTVRVKPANAGRKTTAVPGSSTRTGYTVGGREGYGQVNPARRIPRDMR